MAIQRPTGSGAAPVDLSPVLAAIAGIGSGSPPTSVSRMQMAANGSVAAGYSKLNGMGVVPFGGITQFIEAVFSALATSGAPYTGNLFRSGDGKVRLFGGSTGHFVYDPVTKTWGGDVAFPGTSAGYSSFVAVSATKFIVAGGGGNGTYQPYTRMFDTTAKTWSTLANMPQGRNANTLVFLGNGKVVSVGGMLANGPGWYSNNCDIYDIATNTWSSGANSPVKGYGPACLLAGGIVAWMPYTLTTDGSNSLVSTGRLFLYNSANNIWSEADSLGGGAVNILTGLVPDAAGTGCLAVYCATGAAVRRFVPGNALGTQWVAIPTQLLGASEYMPAGGSQLAAAPDGTVFILCTTSVLARLAVEYNPGNTVVDVVKL
jgi:hypothetical protein